MIIASTSVHPVDVQSSWRECISVHLPFTTRMFPCTPDLFLYHSQFPSRNRVDTRTFFRGFYFLPISVPLSYTHPKPDSYDSSRSFSLIPFIYHRANLPPTPTPTPALLGAIPYTSSSFPLPTPGLVFMVDTMQRVCQ